MFAIKHTHGGREEEGRQLGSINGGVLLTFPPLPSEASAMFELNAAALVVSADPGQPGAGTGRRTLLIIITG